VCRYGYNGVCSSLPLDGVSDSDYLAHIEKYHLMSTMKEAEEKWNIFSAAQNLPAVLNDPSRGRQSNLFTKKWGDSFVEKQQVPPTPHLPQVDWSQLELYCKKIGKRYRRHTKLGSIGNSQDFSAPTPGTISPSSSISSLQIIENSNYRNINEKLLNEATIRDIPQIFLKQDLDLSKQETFALVFHGLNINSDRDHEELQDKLSHYLDIVEIQIAKQV
jgi:vacuolar protein sorting-associated protein 54